MNASQLLKNPKIQAYIQEMQRQRQERTAITADRVIQEIAHIAFSRVTDIFSFDGENIVYKSSELLPESAKAAIAEIGSTKSTRSTRKGEEVDLRLKVKLHSKTAALQQLVKLLGMEKEAALKAVLGMGYQVIDPTTGEAITIDAGETDTDLESEIESESESEDSEDLEDD